MSKRLRHGIGLVGLPLAMGLVLSGCHWGTYTNVGTTGGGQHAYRVVVHQQNTDDSIHACDDNRGSITEAQCVLNVVKLACHQDPLEGWAIAECDQATNYSGTTCRRVPPGQDENCAVAMQRTIGQIRREEGQCITYEQYIGESSHGWSAEYTRPGC